MQRARQADLDLHYVSTPAALSSGSNYTTAAIDKDADPQDAASEQLIVVVTDAGSATELTISLVHSASSGLPSAMDDFEAYNALGEAKTYTIADGAVCAFDFSPNQLERYFGFKFVADDDVTAVTVLRRRYTNNYEPAPSDFTNVGVKTPIDSGYYA